jgi:ABC-type uncharacterized transport system ATPase subunit
VGLAGISGNGQVELMEILTGQRPLEAGVVEVKGAPWDATGRRPASTASATCPKSPAKCLRPEDERDREHRLSHLRRERLRWPRFWLNPLPCAAARATGVELQGQDRVARRARSRTLSGGNVQRAVLARELTGEVDLLIVANPCFGLDFTAVAEIRARIMAARNAGGAVLLISEDLDEIMELADRVLVMSEGSIAYDRRSRRPTIAEIGHHGGH